LEKELTPLEQILALEEIKQLKARYFRCMDTKDWAGYEAVFAPDATIDSSEAFTPRDFRGATLDTNGQPAQQADPTWRFSDPKGFVADLKTVLDGVSTVHHGHMPEIQFTSDTTAKGVWAMEDKIRWPPGAAMREMHGYGHYVETYEKGRDGWRIKSLKLTRVRVDSF
jgi:hypothetical protein